MVSERRDPLVISRPFYLQSHNCGYCQCQKSTPSHEYPSEASIPKTPTHVTIGCKVEQMTCSDYDEFMNLGFRRSGDFLYKGDMLRGCCRMYTIRTELKQMKISKEHRQVVNRFKKAILDPESTKSGKSRDQRIQHNQRFSLSSLLEAERASSRFYTRFEPARFSNEKFALYKKYQTVVHNDKPEDITKSSFTNFLCHSPFLDHEIEGTTQEWAELNTWVAESGKSADKDNLASRKATRLGPTHECYYLDGTLIAISVLDFLPSGVSSVYLIWDPDYAHLSLGTLSGIREIQMCHELNLGYYYLGYYIEDCDKMRYKKKFGGEVLDVCNEAFVPLEAVRPFMQNDQFWAISEEAMENESESESEGGSGSESESESESGEAREGSISTRDEENKQQNSGDMTKRIKSEDPADHSDSDLEGEDDGEHELTLSGKPDQWVNKLDNVAHEIYGSKETYEAAEVALKVLKSELKFSSSELPTVLPGAIPLWQLLAWFEEDVLDSDLPVTVFGARTGRLYECSMGELGGAERAHVMDFLRLFGLERTQSAIIIA